MDTLPILAEPALQCEADEGVTSRRYYWNTVALRAGAVAVLALAVYAFPGNWSALGGGSTLLDGQLQGSVAPADQDASGKLYADLERHLRWQPSDVRAQVFKARLDMDARRYEQAAAGYEKAVAGNSRAALDPGVWVEYAEARGMAQGATLAGEPAKLVQKALSLDANYPQALDLAGSAAWEARDFAGAAVHWKRLLMHIPADTPRHAELSAAIQRAEQRARVSLPVPGSELATRQGLSPTAVKAD